MLPDGITWYLFPTTPVYLLLPTYSSSLSTTPPHLLLRVPFSLINPLFSPRCSSSACPHFVFSPSPRLSSPLLSCFFIQVPVTGSDYPLMPLDRFEKILFTQKLKGAMPFVMAWTPGIAHVYIPY